MKIPERTLLDEIKYYGVHFWRNLFVDTRLYIVSFFQRGFRGYADSDTWDFDLYLAKVISQGVKHLKKFEQGCPNDIYNKYKDRTDLTQKEKDKLSMKEWHTILDIIVRGFELVPELFEAKVLKNKKLKDGHMYELERAFDFLKKYYFNLWD